MFYFRFIVFILLFITTTFSYAEEELTVKDGNIYLGATQITSTNKDRLPLLSEDKKIMVFVRSGSDVVPDECSQIDDSEDKHADQIWIYDVENKKEYLLVASKLSCDKPEEVIINIHDLKFSKDMQSLYFLTSAWKDSDALHKVKLNGTNQHFLAPALAFEIVQTGEYQGYLLIKQRRFFAEGERFDWYWLYTADGKELSPIGPDITEIKKENLESSS